MNDYIEQAMRTRVNSSGACDRLQNRGLANILHGIIGIASEGGELIDQIKRHLYYGDELDVTNIKIELGDVLWFVSIICAEFGWTFDDIQVANIAKLKARYPEMFTKEQALNRDLNKEDEAVKSIEGDIQLPLFSEV